jgi:hypothetical protein
VQAKQIVPISCRSRQEWIEKPLKNQQIFMETGETLVLSVYQKSADKI